MIPKKIFEPPPMSHLASELPYGTYTGVRMSQVCPFMWCEPVFSRSFIWQAIRKERKGTVRFSSTNKFRPTVVTQKFVQSKRNYTVLYRLKATVVICWASKRCSGLLGTVPGTVADSPTSSYNSNRRASRS
jgi:hypothetical protein